MGGYFKPWRRKVGICTLLLVCLFAAGWVRSFFRADCVFSDTSQFQSHNGGILCEIVPERFDFGFSCYSADWKMTRNAYSHPSLAGIWRWKRLGFAFGTDHGEVKYKNGTTLKVTLFRFYLPYWSVVLPLTAFSSPQ